MKNQSRLYKVILSTFVVITIFLTGKYLIAGRMDDLRAEINPQHTQTFEVTSSPLATFTAVIYPATVTPTWTPLPTIQPKDIDVFVQSLNRECDLPCWGNIVSGQTREVEAKHFLSSFGELDDTSVFFQYQDKPVVIDLTFKDGLVTSINLPPEITESYQIGDLLANYGRPHDIRIEVFPETAEGTPWFYLAVFFPQNGFYAVFSGEGKITNSKVNVCLENVFPDLYLVEPNKYSL